MTLPKHQTSGVHPVPRGRAADAEPEPGDHLVEQQHRTDPSHSSRSPSRKPSRGATRPMLAATGSTTHDRDGFVERGHRRCRAHDGVGHAPVTRPSRARRRRQGALGDAGARRRPAARRRGRGSCPSNFTILSRPWRRGPGGWPTWRPRCPRTPAAPAPCPGTRSQSSSARRDLALRRRAEGRALARRPRCDRLDHRRVGVAQDRGAVALHVVDVARSLDVPDGAPSPRATKYGRSADRPKGAHRRVDASGHPGQATS